MALDESEIDGLRHQLRELSDRSEITDLITRLGVWLDGHCLEDPGELFAANVMAETPGGRQEGFDVVVDGARRAHADYARLQHFVSNVLVDLDGDQASAQAHLVAVFISEGEQADTRVLVGHYRLGTLRTPVGWRISRLAILPSWSSPVSEAALIPSPGA
ncbi:nuclear transport factor 2 family protein [Micromonospora sp. NPDC048898]|uniref:nuclear transport factor 2 family protein n=1 Tax=Micromonospora sp. NPDC048898 TaxID=3364260 RepID=UPI00371A5224